MWTGSSPSNLSNWLSPSLNTHWIFLAHSSVRASPKKNGLNDLQSLILLYCRDIVFLIADHKLCHLPWDIWIEHFNTQRTLKNKKTHHILELSISIPKRNYLSIKQLTHFSFCQIFNLDKWFPVCTVQSRHPHLMVCESMLLIIFEAFQIPFFISFIDFDRYKVFSSCDMRKNEA